MFWTQICGCQKLIDGAGSCGFLPAGQPNFVWVLVFFLQTPLPFMSGLLLYQSLTGKIFLKQQQKNPEKAILICLETFVQTNVPWNLGKFHLHWPGRFQSDGKSSPLSASCSTGPCLWRPTPFFRLLHSPVWQFCEFPCRLFRESQIAMDKTFGNWQISAQQAYIISDWWLFFSRRKFLFASETQSKYKGKVSPTQSFVHAYCGPQWNVVVR